jgi:hypothetical protein
MHNVDAFVIPVARYAEYARPDTTQTAPIYVHSVPADQC